MNVEATISSLEQHQPAYLPVEQQLARLEGLCAQTVLPLCYDQYKSLYRYTHRNCTCLCVPKSSLCKQVKRKEKLRRQVLYRAAQDASKCTCMTVGPSCCWWVHPVLHACLLLSISHIIAHFVTLMHLCLRDDPLARVCMTLHLCSVKDTACICTPLR